MNPSSSAGTATDQQPYTAMGGGNEVKVHVRPNAAAAAGSGSGGGSDGSLSGITPVGAHPILSDAVRKHLELPSEDYVWNFAYGSNMNPISLSQRRRIMPVCSVAAVLYNWEMRFNQTGIPAVEPVFASVQPCKDVPGVQVHGVLHKYVLCVCD